MYAVNFPAQTRYATFNPIIEIKDQDTGDLIDLSDIDIIFEIRDGQDCCILKATKDNGIAVIDVGYFQPTFENLKQLCEGTYRVHCSFERDDTTRDIIVGNLPVIQP
jgi:hypothetical protein